MIGASAKDGVVVELTSLVTVGDRLGGNDGRECGSIGDASCDDAPGDVTGDAKECGELDTSESSRNFIDEAEEVEDVAECNSGAFKASILVVEISCMGAEIFPRLIVPEENLTCPSRYGMGAETSGRLLRLVKARVRLDMVMVMFVARRWDERTSCGCLIDIFYSQNISVFSAEVARSAFHFFLPNNDDNNNGQ